LKRLGNNYQQLFEKYKSLEHSHCGLSEAHQVVVTDLQEAQVTCRRQQEEINALKKKLHGTSALLDVRNQEIKVAKTFLSRENLFSTSEIVQSVRDLNSDIMQTAAHLAENLHLKQVHPSRAEEIPEGPYKPILATLVLQPGSGVEVDVGSLELALQGLLAVDLYWIVSAWGVGQASGWCNEIYSKVCETGTQV